MGSGALGVSPRRFDSQLTDLAGTIHGSSF
jgi:hypothetical protein